MDPVTSAIIGALTALAAGASQGLTHIGKTSVVNAYTALKTKLMGAPNTSTLQKVLAEVEENPRSKPAIAQLHHEITAAQLPHDATIRAAAEQLTIMVHTHAPHVQVTNNGTIGKQINADVINGPITM